MTESEFNKAVKEFRAQGWDDNDILSALFIMYRDDKIDLDELRGMTKLLGYEFTDEFEAMSEEEKKKNGIRENPEKSKKGVSRKEVERAKEYGDDEDERDYYDEDEDEEEEVEKKKTKTIKKKDGKEEEKEDEEIERKKAFKMFGIDD